MKRTPTFALAIFCAIGLTALLTSALRADDSDANASVLVELTPLHKGSLPKTVTAYGEIVPSSTAVESVSAQISVKVTSIAVRVGAMVAKGVPMITVAPSPDIRAAYESAKLALSLANQLASRTQSMVKAHLATAGDLAKDENAAATAKSQFAVLEQEGAGGPATIKAPFDGIVLKVDANPGAVVSQGSPLIEIVRPNELVLRVGAVPSQSSDIKPGNDVDISRLGSSDAISGKVLLRGSMVNSDDGLVPIEISFPPGQFLPNEKARATITTGQEHGFIVPHDALLVNDDGDTYVVQAVNMVAKKVTVTVLDSEGDKDLIDGKLDPKSPVVLSGNHQLDDGMKVRLSDDKAKGDDKQASDPKDGK